jgi:SIR2-like domain
LKLFPSVSDVRLVATNFDPHFSTAALSVFSDPAETFYAPALPLGHQFNGIVYLHGGVHKKPETLILTDDDFGRAYLTEGWARRFLQAMFSKYTVLFVGYSHNDVVMNYLARGLPPVPSAPRFALTSEENIEHWKFLEITPLHYPLKCPPERHRVLGEAIADWVDYSKWGILDHEQRIRTIVESPQPLDNEDADLIDRALREHTTTQFFTRYAKTPAWLLWAEGKQPFKSLFQLDIAPDQITVELAHWFVRTFVCQHPGVALSVVERQNQRLHPILWGAIAFQLASDEAVLTQEAFARWVVVLIRSQPPYLNFLSYLLKKCQPQDAVTAILLFEHLTRPRLDLTPNFLPPGAENITYPNVELSFLGHDYFIKQAWQAVFRPYFETFAERLEPILTNHLRHAHLLLQATGKIRGLWDPFSHSCSAIEPDPQDQYRPGIEMLINAARDVLEWMLVHKPDQAQTVITAWSHSDVPLLRRLAIHGIKKSTLLSADEKLAWIQGRNWLYTPGLRNEVFRLLKDAYPATSDPRRLTLLEHVSQGPEGQDAEDMDEEARHY